MLFDATKKSRVAAFGVHVCNHASPNLAAFLIDEGLMIDSGPNLAEIERMAEIFGLTKGEFCAKVLATSDKALDDFFIVVYNHIVDGKDMIDPDSAGGYSQEEIDKIVAFISEN